MIKGSSVRLRVYRSTIVAAAAAAALVSTNLSLATPSFATTLPNVTSATGGNHSATVTWTPKTPGTAYYDIEYLVWPFTGTIIHDYNTPANGTSETTTGLTNGQEYEVIVAETIGSTVYDSQNGVFVTPNPPASAPAAPTGVTGTPDDSSVDLSWTAGSSNNSAITGYTIAYTDATNVNGSGTYSPSGTGTTATVPSLTPGDHYTFTVTATNGIGTGPASASSSTVIPYTAPGAPTGVTATGGNASANVAWTAPASDGFTPITDYEINYTDTSNASGDGVFDTSSTATSATVPGLINGDDYTFAVFADNAANDGPASSPSTGVLVATTPAAPTGVTATTGTNLATANQVTVGWTAPSDSGGLPITGYTISYTDTTTTGHNGTYPSPGAGTSAVVTGLRAGDVYTFTVSATNNRGTGTASSASSGATPVNLPGTPTGISASAGPGGSQGTLHWVAPAANGSTITSYTVEAIDTSDGSGDSDRSTTVAAPATSGTVGGLVPGDIYTIRVIATNAIGDSVPSHASNIITPFTTPGAPSSVSATGGDSSADVSWSAPDNGGSSITGYLITYTDSDNPSNNGSFTSSGSGTSATVPGLLGGESYTFTVAAINAAGTGSASNASSSVDVVSIPGAPTGVGATAGPAGSEATVSWTVPANDGGSAITGYTITLDDGVDPVITVDAGSGDSSTLVDGLVPGAVYTVTVVATNAIGSSTGASASGPVTAYTTPDAPTAVTGTRGNGSVGLTWTAPATGGSPITDYTIAYTDSSDVLGSGTFDTTGTATSATVPGLNNGDSYTFTVTAVNAAGAGTASDPSTAVTPATSPDAPTDLTAAANSSSADLTWNPPAGDGGSAITDYAITYTDIDNAGGDGIFDPSSTSTFATVPDLVPGDHYTFTVAAVNDVGTGSATSPSTAVSPYTTPDAPTGLTATADSSSADLSWTAPGVDGGSALTGYVISYTDTTDSAGNGVYDLTGTGTTATVPDLIPGDSYTFTVTAVNAAGNGTASTASSSVSPFTTPDAPTAVSGTRGNHSVALSWTAPADGGSPITDYTITYTDTTDSDGSGTFDTTSTATSATVSGLTNGDSYTFTVTATNTAGSGSASDPSSAVTPATIPGRPTSLHATADSSAADLTWTAPFDGGSPITGYLITYVDTSDQSGDSDGTTTTVGADASAIVTGLIPGDVYNVTVTPINTVGDGPTSHLSNNVTPFTSSTAPTGVTATAGHQNISVSWGVPEDNGGRTITGYLVTVTTGVTSNTYPVAADTTSFLATGLQAGDAYTVSVVATNAAGTGAVGYASGPVTPYTTPGVPTAVEATAGEEQATVTWGAPISDGASALTGYEVTWTDSTDGSGSGSEEVGTVLLSDTVSLVAGDDYTFTVAAINAAGSGSASDPTGTVTPYTTPGAPTDVVGTPADGAVDLSWTAPADGSSPILDYVVDYVDNTDASSGSATSAGDGTSFGVPGLVNGDSYTFTVTAQNAAGFGDASAASSAVTPVTLPDAPTGVLAVAGPAGSAATVSWTAPASDGGSAITGYAIDYTDSTDSGGDGVYNPTGTGTTATVPDLIPGNAYTFTVVATSVPGNSVASTASNSVSPYTTPDAPTGVTGSRGDSHVALSWTAPADGGSPITDYTIAYTDTSDLLGSGTFDTTGIATSATVPGLNNGDSYTFTVTAVNAAGNSTASDPSSAVTPATTSDAPTSVSAAADSSSADLSWDAPGDDGGSPITDYTITYTDTTFGPDSGSFDTLSTTTSATVPGLIAGDSYTFTVVATNDVGDGTASAPSSAVTPYTTPNQPTTPVATAGSSSVDLLWSANPDGGSPITGYVITYTDTTDAGGDGSYNPTGTGTSATVPDLIPGDSYTFTVTAINAAGSGPASNPSGAVSPYTTPDAPTGVSGTRENSSVDLSWTAAADGGSPITDYTISYTDTTNSDGSGFFDTTGTATSATVPNLTNGDSYTFTVTAINTAGSGGTSDPSSAVTPATDPGTVTGVSAAAGDSDATVTWTAADDGGSPITGYTITYTDTDNPSGDGTFASAGDGISATVPGLIPGHHYTFTVTATNDVGAGSASGSSDAVEVFTTPDAPTGVTATVGQDGAPVVSWTAPGFDGGSPLLSYTIAATDITHSGVTYAFAAADATSLSFTGLVAGDSYTFTVTAFNSDAPGTLSAPSGAVTAYSAPAAPTAVHASAGNGRGSVTWVDPTATGGSPITTFTVIYTDHTNPELTVMHVVDPGETSDGVTLIAGDSYTVTVIATNLYGSSAPSAASGSLTPYSVAGAPTGVTATPGDGTAAVRWTAPASTGHTAITGYVITVTDRTGRTTRSVRVGPSTSATVTGLTNTHQYTFSVVAVNAAGFSPASATSTAVIPVLALVVRGDNFLPAIGVGLHSTLADFSLTLNRPGAVTVQLVKGTTVVSSTSVAAGGTAISGSVRIGVTRVALLGDYTWVVRDAAGGRVLLTRGVVLKQNSFLGLVATRSGKTISLLGVAKWASLDAGTVLPLGGKAIAVQQYTAKGWVTVRTVTTGSDGHINLALAIRQRVGLRLVEAGTTLVVGVVSNTATL